MGMIEIKKGLIILLVTSLLILNQQNDDTRYIKKLIDKIDSGRIKERKEALNKLKKLAENDKKVLESLKSESENEENSYNARFFLKRLINDMEKIAQEFEEKGNTTGRMKVKEENTGNQQSVREVIRETNIAICKGNNKCEYYEASSCSELFQKYPHLRNKFKCDSNDLTIPENPPEGIDKKLKQWEKRVSEIIGSKKAGEVLKNKEDFNNLPQKIRENEKDRNFEFDVEELTNEELKNLDIDNGVRVKNVQKDGSGAKDLKLQKDDIIISINGEKVENKWELKRRLKMLLEEGDIREMEIMRNGKVQKLTY